MSTVSPQSLAKASARLWLGVLVLSSPWGAGGAAWAQAPLPPEGAEFRVNSYTTYNQDASSVASDASGNFVVVWQSDGHNGGNYEIFGQRFSANGVPRGAEFQVNAYTTNQQLQPAVASDANGNFVVVWRSRDQDGSDFGVFGRRFDAAGTPLASEFQINTYTTGFQSEAAVVYLSNGSFVVAWDGFGSDPSMIGVFARQFDTNGSPLGSQFQVNSFTTDYQYLPALAADPNGGFVVAWSSYTQDGADGGVFARRYDAAGAPLGGEFQVNSYTTNSQGRPLLATDASGNFIVVWMSLDQDGSNWGLFAQAFDAAGNRFGSEFPVNTYTTGLQGQHRVGADQKGNFVVVWHSSVQDGSGFGVFGRRLDVFGPAGSEFLVTSYTTSAQATPALGTSPDGDFVVAWASVLQDGSGWGIFGQRYGDILFQDGFESGDLTRWSSASTDGGDVSVTGGAALANTLQGMQVLVDDTTGVFVQDDSPNAEAQYRARFYFDTNGFDPGEAQSHLRTRMFIAFDNANRRQITIVLRRQQGQYSVMGRVRLNDGTRADTGFVPIPGGPNFVEFAWNRATRAGAANGDFLLIVNDDDEGAIRLTGLDNDLGSIEFARLGAMTVKTGASGTLLFDQFESRRSARIGPECCSPF